MPAEGPIAEYLNLRGWLDRTGRLSMRRCTSTPFVRSWPRGTFVEELAAMGLGDGKLLVEMVTQDTVLHEEVAEVCPDVDCLPGEEQRFRVTASIALHPDAETVRIRRGDRPLWEMQVPESPRLAVALDQIPERHGDTKGRRRRQRNLAVLRLDFSTPADDRLAFIHVVHQWAERAYKTVYLGPPTDAVEIDTSPLPGGSECRFVVTYSNGLRAIEEGTDGFDLDPLGPSVTIARPGDGEQVIAGTPVVLQGFAEDPERPPASMDREHLLWSLDDAEVAVGPSSSVDRLEPGRHQIRLTYRGDTEASATVAVEAVEPATPPADDWEDWDPVELR